MRFWKQIMLSLALFSVVIAAVVHTSCQRNACDNITCNNGGACGAGVCRCPTGYEDPTCSTKTITRYIGTYAGYTTCINDGHTGAPIIDTAFVTAANRGPLSVDVRFKSISPKILQGYVSSNESTYAIVVTNDDSTKVGTSLYLKQYTITLQNDTRLSIHTYEHQYTAIPDTTTNECSFLGTKTKK